MTAIFAYAKDDVAFVIADTKRNIALGGKVCAKKVRIAPDTRDLTLAPQRPAPGRGHW
jgi:hypothetical protein